MAILLVDALERLRAPWERNPTHRELAHLLCVQKAALGQCSGTTEESLEAYLARVEGMLRVVDSNEGAHWAEIVSLLVSSSSGFRASAVGG